MRTVSRTNAHTVLAVPSCAWKPSPADPYQVCQYCFTGAPPFANMATTHYTEDHAGRKGVEPSRHGAGAIRAWAVCWAQPHQQLGDEVRQEAPPALNAQQANHGAGDDGNEGATASTGRTAQIMPCSVEQRFALIHPTYKYPRTPMLCRRVSGLTASSCGRFFAAMVLRCSRVGASAPALAPACPRERALASTRLPTCAALAMNGCLSRNYLCVGPNINMLLAFGIEAAHSQTRKAINNEQ